MNQDSYAELAEMAGGFIHEIKNHLSTLGLNLQLLGEDFQDPKSQKERRALARVQRLQADCQRLVQIANDFLHFARLKDLALDAGDLGKVVEEMIDFFTPTARAAKIEIKSYLPADLPPVLLHREMFKQALLNLLLNARQAMPEGGELTFQAKRIFLDGLPLARESDESSPSAIELSLIDTGQGMSPEIASKIFKPFFSTRPGGTGLGLATTRKIIEAHKGTIEVQSEPGKGSKFTIRLPVAEVEG